MEFIGQGVNEKTWRYFFLVDGIKMSFREWIRMMKKSDEVVETFSQVLEESEYDAYFWEVKPIDLSSLDDVLEFVVVKSKGLVSISARGEDFKQYFNMEKGVVHFPNIGANAELIVPTPISDDTDYAHLAKFVRTGSRDQKIEFWREVIRVYESMITDKPKWLSTSGLGVHWLHVRVDSRPKYYQHMAYKKWGESK